jgi:hypothetical protein
MKTLALVFPALLLGLAAACSSGGGGGAKVPELSDFDTSCQADSDCLAVYIGAPGCCTWNNAVINKSDQAKYEAEVAAEGPAPPCDEACTNPTLLVPVCAQGTCAIAKVSCGPETCLEGQVCAVEQSPGGAPDGGGQTAPSYHCWGLPATCGGDILTCDCAQVLCAAGSTCQGASGATVQCVATAP